MYIILLCKTGIKNDANQENNHLVILSFLLQTLNYVGVMNRSAESESPGTKDLATSLGKHEPMHAVHF